MPIYRSILPVVSLLMVVFLAGVPWGLPPAGRLALALLPGIVIFYWSAREQNMLPAFWVFLAGLFLDVLSGDALGHWALVFLVAFGASILVFAQGVAVFGFGSFGFPIVAVAMLVVVSVLQMISFKMLVPLVPVLVAFLLVLLAYPVVVGVLRILQGPVAQRERRFERFG